MHWKLIINPKLKDVQVTIEAPEMTDSIKRLTEFIDQITHTILLRKESQQVEVYLFHLVYIENMERTTFVYTNEDMYEIDYPLYEMEGKLNEYGFIRINKQTIINPRKIQSVRALLNSRFELCMTSGEKLIVTRHYRNSFKSLFAKGEMYDA